jgi:hypothetical protein
MVNEALRLQMTANRRRGAQLQAPVWRGFPWFPNGKDFRANSPKVRGKSGQKAE